MRAGTAKVARSSNRGSKPGEHRGGRSRGTPNKLTATVKDMILQALNDAHPKGGAAYLKDQAEKNPTAFLTLVGKVLPLQHEHSGPDGKPIDVRSLEATDAELLEIATRSS